MVVIKPKPVRTDSVDDIQTIGNVEQLYQQFVVDIDSKIRSFADAPGLGVTTAQSPRGYNTDEEKLAATDIQGSRVDPIRYQESRTHAFYRLVGFPVAAPNNSYYNSGHDRNQRATLKTRQRVDFSLISGAPDVIRLISKREDQFKERRDIFARQDNVAIVYALLLRKPRPFLSAQTGQSPFFADEQKSPLDNRKVEINDLNISANDVPDIITNVPHILKPFIVNPSIEAAVAPEETHRVAVPFLASPAELNTGVGEDSLMNRAASRPIIEQVIHNRLKVKEEDTSFIEAANRIITNESTDATSADIRSTLLALSGQGSVAELTQDVIDTIQDFTTLESTISTTLVKAIKVCVNELNVAIRDLEQIRAQINLQPIPDVNGPEFPQRGRIRTVGGLVEPSEIQQKQAVLQLIQLSNEILEGPPDTRVGNNAYVSGISVDLTKDLSKPIEDLKRIEDQLAAQALKLLATIEKVTGEVSGLGLVDILAVYTALYTIDIRFLIGFLDDNSLTRLDENFHELVSTEVFTQLTGDRPSITECLMEFEKIFFNILAFADSLRVTSNQTPLKARKGSPSR